MKADEPTINGNIYPKKVLEKAIEEYRGIVESRRAFGTLGYSESFVISLSDVSHIVTKVDLESENMMVEIEVLDTKKGEELMELIRAGEKFHFGLKGFGSIDENRVVGIDYTFSSICVDIDPQGYVDKTQFLEVIDEGE